MDITKHHRRAVENFAQKVQQVSDDQWDAQTPCTEWDVRALVNHVVGEELWVKPLVDGKTIEDVGTDFDGDVLGDDPRATAAASATEASDSFDRGVRDDVTVHLSFGDTPAAEYAMQLTADHLIHGWDLAAATGMDRAMHPELVSVVAEWFASQEEMWRASGAIGPRAELTGDPQADLLAAFGRNANWEA